MKSLKNIIYTGCTFVALSFLFSCEEEISYDAISDEDAYVVVEGRVVNENKQHIFRVTKSDDYFSGAPAPASNVTTIGIRALGEGVEYALSPVDTGVGYYISEPFEGVDNEEYKLEFVYQGEKYEANTILDSIGEMDSIVVEYEYISYMQVGFYKVKMYAFEPEPKGDYYMGNLYINDTLYNDKLASTTFFDDELLNGQHFMGVDMYYIRQEEITEETYDIRFELLSISREEYLFNNAFLSETQSNGNMFSGPPADVPTNIYSIDSDKRGFGFFAASATTSAETKLIKVHDESTNDPDYKK